MRLDCLTDRPSWLESVFCRVIGWKEPEEEVEVRDAGWSIVATDMWCVACPAQGATLFDLKFFAGTSVRNEVIIQVPYLSYKYQTM